jgi:peroxiredoxin
MKKLFLLLMVTSVIGFSTACKSKKKTKKSTHVTIAGIVKGQIGVKDSVRILFGSLIPESKVFGVIDTTLYTDSKGKFVFRSPDIQEPTRVTIYSQKKRLGEIGSRFRDGLRDYLVEPSDSIAIEIDKAQEELNYRFSGTGSAKFRIRWQNDLMGYKVNLRKIQRRYGKRFAKLSTRVQIADSLTNLQINRLKIIKDSLTHPIFQIMTADIIGQNGIDLKPFSQLMHLDTLSPEGIDWYKKLFAQSMAIDLPESALARSSNYILFLSNMAIAQLQFENPKDSSYHYGNLFSENFGDYCRLLRTQYSGLLREKLLLYNLQRIRVQDTYGLEECIQSSYDLIKTPELKAIMETMYGRKMRGTAGFDFRLPNTKGELVSLSDFKGKVVYLDIWFTGCSGCMALAKEVDHQVYPKFKDSPEVVFVSISADKSREQWLKSVDAEKYGLKQYVNLHTDGLGFKHPFMAYYNIIGAPVTMLFDKKGRLFSAAPPKHGKSEALISLINEAINL